MFTKRHRITLLFNANKAYDRQVVEGVGEYLQASQSEWDIFIEEDFRARIDKIKDWLGDGVIADFDDKQIEQALADVNVPIVGVGGSYHLAESYPPVHYIATDNYALVESAFLHLKEKGVNRFAFYGLPEPSGKRWPPNASMPFASLWLKRSTEVWFIRGWKPHQRTGNTRKIGWQTGCKRCHRKQELLPSLTPGRGIFCKYASICTSPYRKNYA